MYGYLPKEKTNLYFSEVHKILINTIGQIQAIRCFLIHILTFIIFHVMVCATIENAREGVVSVQVRGKSTY